MSKAHLKNFDIDDLYPRLSEERQARWDAFLDTDPETHVTETNDWIRSMSDEQVLCRGYGHLWDIGGSTVAQLPHELLGHALVCVRCSTEKWEVYSQNSWKLIDRKYVWPDGYKRPEEALDIPRSAFRNAAQRRQKPIRNLKPSQVREEFQSIVTKYMDTQREQTAREQALCSI